jgi:inositol-phosphate phosphatase/L-galactose 1-phosphate phosphatase/histidinol-phosphatase
MSVVPSEFVSFALSLADEAAEVTRHYFRQPSGVEYKEDDSPVSLADREAEGGMREQIRARYPAHGILGEEHGNRDLDAEWVWVLDPIDGTKAFLAGIPTWGTLIALTHRGSPVLGVIDQPVLRERWLGIAAQETTLNGNPVRARACPNLADAIFATTSPFLFDEVGKKRIEKVTNSVCSTIYGGDCTNYARITTGRIDLVIESGLKPYDFCALLPVVAGSGGLLTDWRGHPLSLNSNGDVVAAGDKRVHHEALGMLA